MFYISHAYTWTIYFERNIMLYNTLPHKHHIKFGLYYKLIYICPHQSGRNASNINFPLFKATGGL